MKLSEAMGAVRGEDVGAAEAAVDKVCRALVVGVSLPEDPLAKSGPRGMMAVPADLDRRHEGYSRLALAVEARARQAKQQVRWAEAVLEDRRRHLTATDEEVRKGKNAEVRAALLAERTGEQASDLRTDEAALSAWQSMRAQLALVEARLQFAKELHSQQVKLAEIERGLTPGE
jgi:hypothetical protein